MEDCIFCKIISSDIPSSKLYEDEQAFAFMDIHPITKGHTLVVPKTHAQLIPELDDAIAADLLIVVKKLDAALRQLEGVKDISIHIADGPAAQQEVPHVHIHLIPRHENDGFGLKFPEGYGEMAKPEELTETANKIKEKM